VTTPVERAAGAPVSWGIGEVPGSGHRLDLETVLGQIRSAGLTAIELGAGGYLPAAPDRLAAVLAAEGLRAAAGTVEVVAHEPAYDPEPVLVRELARLTACDAGTVVLVAATGGAAYEPRPELDGAGWVHLLTELDRLAAVAATHGVQAALLPRQGSMIDRPDDVAHVLDAATIDLCLDTGHAVLAGADPVRLAHEAGGRVVHVHLKDVDAGLAQQVRSGALGLTTAVAQGLYVPLGEGCARPLDVVRTLERRHYAGWYVVEQDTVLTGPQDAKAALADVLASVAALAALGAVGGGAAR